MFEPKTRFRFPAAVVLVTLALLASPALAHPPKPLQVTAAFLELSDEQVQQVVAIRTVADEASAPLVQEIVARKHALAQILEGDDPNPVEVGALAISIRALERQVAAIQAHAAAEMRALLDDEQLARLSAAAEARPLCRVVPALRALHLL